MKEKYSPVGKCRVGWYHTHPTQGIFFSGLDKDAHTIFRQPYQFALVIDPRSMDAGLFYWQDAERHRLGGPVLFSLRPGGRRVRNLASADPPPRGTNWFALAGAGVCVALVIGGLASRGQRFSLLDVSLIGASTLIAYRVLGMSSGVLRDASNAKFFDSRWRDALSMGALAILTFWSGIRVSVPPTPAAVSNSTIAVNRQDVRPPMSNGARPVPQRHVVTPAPTAKGPGAQVPARKRVVFVNQNTRGSVRRVVLESPQPRASVAYQLRRCRQAGGRINVGTCRIQVDRGRERAFLDNVCAGTGPLESCVKEMQLSLGFNDRGVDGLWGPNTRVRFLREAIRARGRVAGNATSDFIFERKPRSRARASRRSDLQARFLPAE
jgi:hypothetical protein